MSNCAKAWNKVMQPLGRFWMKEYDHLSKAEGWALFQCDSPEGYEGQLIMRIQALDDPEEGQATLKGGDAEAYQICVQKALRGSKLHMLALYMDGRVLASDEESFDDVYVPAELLSRQNA